MTIATPVEQLSPHAVPDDRVAGHLAGQLRTSRLTVLYGGSAGSVSEFIATAVVPRLGQRHWDRRLAQPRQTEFTGPGQSGRISKRQSGASAELPVLIDRWSGSAIATLQARINDSLDGAGAYMTSIPLPIGESLSAWSQVLDLRFLIILDRFEEFLERCADSDDGRAFTQELVEVLRRPELAVNFLICVAASSEDRMQRYQTQLAGLDLDEAFSIRLPLHRVSATRSASDLTLIQWREAPFARQLAAPNASTRQRGSRPSQARGGLRAAVAATMTAIAVFCWPLVQPGVHFDAAGYLTLAARAVEQASDLLHRLQNSLGRMSLCGDGRSPGGDKSCLHASEPDASQGIQPLKPTAPAADRVDGEPFRRAALQRQI